jgi:predicted TIM-barrel fold metal-dependent hydrolase
MAGLSKVVDVHSHVILAFGERAPVELGHKQPDWSVELALSYMEEHGISACVLSAPASANNATGQEARDIARRINEVLAEIVSKHPNRFGAVATLPGLNADGAIAEIGYALDTLKMDGVATTTSIDDVYLGEPRFDSWFEELNRRSTTLFVHPTVTKAGETLLNGLNASVLEFMFDTTRMITNMVATGAKRRFSRIKIISTHGGGAIPFLVNRIQTLEHTFGVGPGRLELSSEEVREGIRSFYYDLTAATSEAQLEAILKLIPISQLLMGLDFPLMPKSTFAPAIADVGRYQAFSEADLRNISYANAFQLFPALARRIGKAHSTSDPQFNLQFGTTGGENLIDLAKTNLWQ